jgi:acetyltransferase-like isoleucine patch superfamily enzyme
MLLQLVPLAVIYPMRRALQWTIFLVTLTYTQRLTTNDVIVGRLFNLTVCIAVARIAVRCFAPFVGILAKWLIIGRYREGLYPMWGLYYTRWWLVQKILAVCGKGFFGATNTTQHLYYRLTGARIGRRVKLSGVALGEYDLIDIMDDAVLTRYVCRPFAAEGNTAMYLGRIVVGEKCSVGVSSIISPGFVIPPNTCIGPNSSSWEFDDADEANRNLCPNAGPDAHWLLTCFFTLPLRVVAWVASLLPWFAGLLGMVINPTAKSDSPLLSTLDWFTDPKRLAYHYLALILRTFFSPFILFGFTIIVKFVLDTLFGKLTPGPAQTYGAVATWRAALTKTLLPIPHLHSMTTIFSQHYEATSIAIRMLGGKIGKLIYRLEIGPSISDYHLLDIGNDVVFSSRAHFITSSGTGSEKITIQDRAMIADCVCLLPGVDIGERAIMGSGTLTRRGKAYEADGTYVGSRGGDAICLSTGRDKFSEQTLTSTSTPHNDSKLTLTEDHVVSKTTGRTQIQRTGSEPTLVKSRKPSSKDSYDVNQETLASDSVSRYKPSEGYNEDASPLGRAFYIKLAPYHIIGLLPWPRYSQPSYWHTVDCALLQSTWCQDWERLCPLCQRTTELNVYGARSDQVRRSSDC